MMNTDTRMTSTMMMMSSVVGAASLGLAALLATGCAELDDEPAVDPELASTDSALVTQSYARWDAAPGAGNLHQLRVIGNADGRLALFGRTPGGSVQLSQQIAINGGWTAPITLDGAGSPDLEVVRELDGRLGVLALGGGDRAVYYRTQTSPGAATFTAWTNLGAGTGGATDMEVGQHADGRVVVFILGGDRTIWARTQTTPGGDFGPWESHGGASTQMRVTSLGGRIGLVAYTTVGTLYVKDQPAANDSLGNWSYVGQATLTDLDVTRLPHGRLHVAFVSPSDPQRALRWLDQSSTGVWTAYSSADTGPHTAIELLELSGANPIAFTAGTDGHARLLPYFPYNYNYYPTAYDLAGAGLVDLAVGRNQDGRFEVFGRTSTSYVWQTWQTAAGVPGTWRALPAAPAIDAMSATPTAPLKNNPVDIYWRLGPIPAGCTPSVYMSDDNGVFYGVAGATSGTARDPAITRDTTYTTRATCTEIERSGVSRSTTRTLLVKLGVATTPPGIYETTFALGQDYIYSGPITYSAVVFPNSTSSTLVSLWYAQSFGAIKLLPPSASNYDCENPNVGIFLAAQTWATPAQIAALYGTSSPAMPLVVRGCSSAFMTARYNYQP